MSDELEQAAAELEAEDDLVELRREAAAKGADLGTVTDLALTRLLEAFSGDVDLAIAAAAMVPRPDWVAEFLGLPSDG